MPLDLLKSRLAKDKPRCMIVTGAGVSRGASGDPAATWKGLLESGVERLRSELEADKHRDLQEFAKRALDSSTVDFWIDLAERIENGFRNRQGTLFRRWLQDTIGRLGTKDPMPLETIAGLDIPIATTNYDRLIETCLDSSEAITWQDIDLAPDFVEGVDRGRYVLHLHGVYDQPETVVLGRQSYKCLQENKLFEAYFRYMFSTRSAIFVGFGGGLHDPTFKNLLDWIDRYSDQLVVKHFIFRCDQDPDTLLPSHYRAWLRTVECGPKYRDIYNRLMELASARKGVSAYVVSANAAPPHQTSGPQISNNWLEALVEELRSALMHGSTSTYLVDQRPRRSAVAANHDMAEDQSGIASGTAIMPEIAVVARLREEIPQIIQSILDFFEQPTSFAQIPSAKAPAAPRGYETACTVRRWAIRSLNLLRSSGKVAKILPLQQHEVPHIELSIEIERGGQAHRIPIVVRAVLDDLGVVLAGRGGDRTAASAHPEYLGYLTTIIEAAAQIADVTIPRGHEPGPSPPDQEEVKSYDTTDQVVALLQACSVDEAIVGRFQRAIRLQHRGLYGPSSTREEAGARVADLRNAAEELREVRLQVKSIREKNSSIWQRLSYFLLMERAMSLLGLAKLERDQRILRVAQRIYIEVDINTREQGPIVKYRLGQVADELRNYYSTIRVERVLEPFEQAAALIENWSASKGDSWLREPPDWLPSSLALSRGMLRWEAADELAKEGRSLHPWDHQRQKDYQQQARLDWLLQAIQLTHAAHERDPGHDGLANNLLYFLLEYRDLDGNLNVLSRLGLGELEIDRLAEQIRRKLPEDHKNVPRWDTLRRHAQLRSHDTEERRCAETVIRILERRRDEFQRLTGLEVDSLEQAQQSLVRLGTAE